MKSDIVTIEPEVVQFGRDNIQTIKIINNTSAAIPNFFFCLYNTEKFTFSPDSFSLAPKEHRLVTITLRLKSVRSVAKEFAYLKSSQINRRITLLINSFQSPQAKSRVDEGIQDVNTFSSRQYNEIQTEAIERIIKEKQAYIELLEKERDTVNRHIDFRTQESAQKAGLIKKETEQIQMKLILAENEKQSILKENYALQQKFEEYRKFCEVDLKNYEKIRGELASKSNEISKLHQQIQYLEGQGEQFIKKLQEKEAKIRQLQISNRKNIDQQKKQTEKKIALIQGKLEEQKRSYHQTSRNSQDRIRELERKLQNSQKYRHKSVQLEQNLKRKDQQIKSLMQAVESQRNTLRELQGQKKKLIKYEVMNESMGEKNNELTSRLKEMQKINYNLKEELFVYKNKLTQTDNSSDKMNQYLEIALQSCKSQNDALKRTKRELEKSLDQFMAINRQTHDNNRLLSQQVEKYKQEATLLLEIKDNLEKRNQQLKQEHHLAMMKLKTENVELLERLSASQTARRQQRIKLLQDQLIFKQRDLQRHRANENKYIEDIQSLKEENAVLADKVRRYKKQTKKQLKSINQSAISQINRDKQQKKALTQKIGQLEQVIIDLNCQKTRNQKNRDTKGDSAEGHLRKERTSSRVIGIKDQRKQIHQSSKAYSQTSNQQNIYSQLGELRQLNNYIRNQQERFNRILSLQQQEQFEQTTVKAENRAVFRAIRFFKRLQNKIREIRGESQMSNMKQIEFMRGRIKELQSIKDDKDNNTSVNLSKTREQFSQLLEYIREQMRNQYKKLNDHIRLLQHKHDLLKKKIYEEYRAKIIDVLNKKEKNSISQLQVTLERFIDGMSNLSHKEAVLNKEVKLKQNARKQNIELKQKVNTLNQMLQTKKGYCTRDPLKVIYNETDVQWQESLKRQAQLLTLSAEYQRIKEQFDILSEELSQSKNNYSRIERELQEKSSEILKLKRYQIEIQSNYQNEIQKQSEIIEENKRRILEFTKSGKQIKRHSHKDKDYSNMKETLEKQRDVIRVLRQKQKMLEEVLQESHQQQEKQRKKINEQNRVIQSLRDLKQNNRELRTQNGKLKEKLVKLEDDLEKKNLYVKNLKGDLEQNRVRVQKKEQLQAEKMKQEIKRLSEEIKRVRDELQKTKKKREKEISEHKNQIDKLTNQNLISVKSLQSIIRALMDNLRDVFGRLRFYIKKRRGKEIGDHNGLFDTSRSVNIDGLKISEAFSTALEIIEASE